MESYGGTNSKKNEDEDNFILAIFVQPYIHWQHIEKEIKEVPKGVFNFCLQEEIRKEIIRQYSILAIQV